MIKYSLLLFPLMAISSLAQGVRLELSMSPRTEIAGAVGIYLKDECYMVSAGRINNEHFISLYQEKVMAVSVGNHCGFYGAKQIGCGYISPKIDAFGAYAGVAVGFYYRCINLFAFYASITYIDDKTYRLSGQVYIGLSAEF